MTSATLAHQVQYTAEQFSSTTAGEYDRIVVGSDFAAMSPESEPELPVQLLTYVLPPNFEATGVQILASESQVFQTDCYLYPTQPDTVIGCRPRTVGPDSSIYGQTTAYPASPMEIVHQGTLDGASLVSVAIRPMFYFPQQRELHLYTSLTFDFVLAPRDPPERALVRGQVGQRAYEQMLSGVVQNHQDLAMYYIRPSLVPETEPTGEFVPFPKPEQYTIITSDELVPSFLPLVEWLTDKGVPATVVSVSHTLHHFPGVDDAERMREYIRYGWKTCGTIWVLLAGDSGWVPMRKGSAVDGETPPPPSDRTDENTPPSDWYYTDLSGEWDYDGDGRFGEPTQDRPDLYPEVFVGRVLVRTPQEVSNWAEKELQYEQICSSDLDLMKECTWTYDQNSRPPLVPNLAPGTTALFPAHFTFHYLNSGDAHTCVLYHDAGAGFTVHYNHGACRDFCPNSNPWQKVWSYWDGQRTVFNDGVNNIQNAGRYGMVYSISCYCAAYDPNHYPQHGRPDLIENLPSDTCVADALTDAYATKGAVAYLANTRFGWPSGSSYLFREFCRQLFGAEGPFSLAGIEAASKILLGTVPGVSYKWYVSHAHNLFGTPEFEPWINAPGTFEVEHPDYIPVGVTTPFTVVVRTAGQTGLAEVRVCLHKDGDVYAVGWTGADGTVTFLVTPATEGILEVTCYKPRPSTDFSVCYDQYLPKQTTCRVGIEALRGSAGEATSLPRMVSLATEKIARRGGGTVIRYGLPENSSVRLELWDVSGRHVGTLVNRYESAGDHAVDADQLDAALSAGSYYVVLLAGGERRTAKLALVK
jgi:hypothetical protein